MRDYCKEQVEERTGSLFGGTRQCSRYAVKDGYCKQHHPDAVKARVDKLVARRAADADVTAARCALREKQEELLAYLMECDPGEREAWVPGAARLMDEAQSLQAALNAANVKRGLLND